ncbi:flagellar assembly protein FliW [Clostridium sp. D2Q-11]|uniref:Flagellar assembly factor FliW n=1 Tax=Anaeromonas frigoriresistens TaxID=2683708 RepID=A0A942UWK3_9FIRM|nr:flagellar assembly protein FliW [Anaeromonas frigoriresistens]MBS4538144.1 flagellar assembly protein FliW [Anaeromonas frigoriresistens]
MIINTKNFGNIEVLEESIIQFSEGIPGFQEQKRFVIIENEDEENPFQWLQAIDTPELAFVIINPFIFKKDYDFNIPESVVEKLNINSPHDIAIYTIVVVPEDIKKMTANLSGPVIINAKEKLAKQIILDDKRYNTKYPIFQDKGQEE